MPKITFLKPTDQPTGIARLITELRTNLGCHDLDDFRIIVAFAKIGPLLRLAESIGRWKNRGGSIKAIFGVDLLGTSLQALEFALANFQETNIAYVPGDSFSPTFHPKIYLFTGAKRAVGYIGSNNLTVGGTETNLETYVKLDLGFPADDVVKSELLACWNDALRTAVHLDAALLAQLVAAGMLLDETDAQRTATGRRRLEPLTPEAPVFPPLAVLPPSPIPRGSIVAHLSRRKAGRKPKVPAPGAPVAAGIGAQALVMHIVPHHNGEVFLSKLAADQDPAFLGWPFTGKTMPKKPSNPSYPQRIPDPVVDLRVFNVKGALVVEHNRLKLNTVYYAAKSEIRITVPRDVVKNAPEYSILVMRQAGQVQGLDYTLDIYVPGSVQYNRYLAVCNQTMPSGGRAAPRRFGWL